MFGEISKYLSDNTADLSDNPAVYNIHWHILNKCNLNCLYCASISASQDYIISQSLLLQMAWRVLKQPYSAYHITFSGGEALLHPVLPELISYILGAGKEAVVTLETNGTGNLSSYMGLVKDALRPRLRFAFALHPSHSDTGNTLPVLAELARIGHPVQVNLIDDGTAREKSKNCALELIQLRVRTPFSLRILPLGTPQAGAAEPAEWIGQVNNVFSQICADTPAPLLPPPFDGLQPPPAPGRETQSGEFCCAGNYLRIEANGRFSCFPCGREYAAVPLWQASDLEITPPAKLLSCASACGYSFRFVDQAGAEQWLKDREMALAASLDANPMLLNPASSEPEPAQLILGILKGLQPASTSSQLAIPAIADLYLRRLNDITRIAAAMDDKSREIWLRCIKALHSGTPVWLPEGVPHSFNLTPPEDGSLCRDEIVLDEARGAGLKKWAGIIRQHRPNLVFATSPAEESLVDLFAGILDMDPNYRFHVAWTNASILTATAHTPERNDNYAIERANRKKIKTEIRDRLANLRPLRRFVDTVNPETTAIIVFGSVLEEAISYYGNILPDKKPDFIVADWQQECRPEWREVAERYGVRIFPMSERLEAGKEYYCLYGKIGAPKWGSGSIFNLTQHIALNKWDIDYDICLDSTKGLIHKKPPQPYLATRLDDICDIYAAIGDEESREVFLRIIKALEVGDPGYIPNAAYPQYCHPATLATTGDVVIEGGLDNGETTRAFLESVGQDGKVYGFEPVTAAWDRSCSLVGAHPNVVIEKLGLWSEPGNFYIEDQGGGSTLSYEAGVNMEECSCIDIDSYVKNTGSGCDLIKLDIEGSEPEALKGAIGVIGKHAPKLQISIYHQPEHALDLPLWILRNAPNYIFYFGHHRFWWNETMLYAKPHKQSRPSASFIVVGQAVSSSLDALIHTIAVQAPADFEIIFAIDKGVEEVRRLTADAASSLTGKFHVLPASGDGAKNLNDALWRAQGSLMLVIPSDSILPIGFFNAAARMMARTDADIAVLGADEEGVVAGEDALEWLAMKGGPVPLMIRRDFLIRNNLAALPGLPLVSFSIRLFYYAQAVAHYPGDSAPFSSSGSIEEVANFSQWLANFFGDHAIINPDLEKKLLAMVFPTYRQGILQNIRDAQKEGDRGKLPTMDTLRKLSESRSAMEVLIREYALLNAWRRNLHFSIAPDEEDWREAAARPYSPGQATPFENADAPTTPPPLLSVVMPNFNHARFLDSCIRSILSQSMRDFELIIVDDMSTDDSWQLLKKWAQCEPRIRLYRMDKNSRQGVCRNIGVDKARGKYILFADSDDGVEPGYFQLGVKLMEDTRAEAGLFSYQARSLNGEVLNREILADDVISGEEARQEYIYGRFNGAPFSKIFLLSHVRSCGARFAQEVFHQDHHFVGPAVAAASIVARSSFIACSAIQTPDSSVRPKNFRYLYIHSAARFYDHMQRMLYPGDGLANVAKGVLWSMDFLHMAAWLAYLERTGEIALSENDYQLLARSPIFLLALLIGYASQTDGVTIPSDLLEGSELRHSPPLPARPDLSIFIYGDGWEKEALRSVNSVLKMRGIALELIIPGKNRDWVEYDAWCDLSLRIPNARILANLDERDLSSGEGIEYANGTYSVFLRMGDDLDPIWILRAIRALHHHPDAQVALLSGGHGEAQGDEMAAGASVLTRLHDCWQMVSLAGPVFRTEYLTARKPPIRPRGELELAAWLLSSSQKSVFINDKALKLKPLSVPGRAIELMRACSLISRENKDAARIFGSWLAEKMPSNIWIQQAARAPRQAFQGSGAIARRLLELEAADLGGFTKLCLPDEQNYEFQISSGSSGPKLLSILIDGDGVTNPDALTPFLSLERDDFEVILLRNGQDGNIRSICNTQSGDPAFRICQSVWDAPRGLILNCAFNSIAGAYTIPVANTANFPIASLSHILDTLSGAKAELIMLKPGEEETVNPRQLWESLMGKRAIVSAFDRFCYRADLLKRLNLQLDPYGAADDAFLFRAMMEAKNCLILNTPEEIGRVSFSPDPACRISRLAGLAAATREINSDAGADMADIWHKYLEKIAPDLLPDLAMTAASSRSIAHPLLTAAIEACHLPSFQKLIMARAGKKFWQGGK